MSQPKVSIISPIHNPGKYLIPLLDSFCNQTLKDIEIILVDDGSTDGSRDILQEYKEKDNRIQVILRDKSPNERFGQKASVDAGRKIAKGEYIIMIDHDDELMLNCLQKLYDATDNGTIDVVQGRNISIDENNELVYYTTNYWNIKTVITSFESLNLDEIWHHLILAPTALWICLIKNEFQKDLELSDCVYNDVDFIWKLKIAAQSFCYIPDYIYKQNMHHGSTSSPENADKNELDVFIAFQNLERFLKERAVSNNIWQVYSIYEFNTLYVHMQAQLSDDIYNIFMKKYAEEMNRNIDISQIIDKNSRFEYNLIKQNQFHR